MLNSSGFFIIRDQFTRQIEYSFFAIERIKSFRKERSPVNMVFYHIQALFIALANITELLGGKNNFLKGEIISCFSINKEKLPYLLNNKEIRNTFVHYDERICSFVKKAEGKAYADCNIGTISLEGESGGFYNPDAIYMRHFDDKNGVIYSINQKLEPIKLELLSIEKELNYLKDLITADNKLFM